MCIVYRIMLSLAHTAIGSECVIVVGEVTPIDFHTWVNAVNILLYIGISIPIAVLLGVRRVVRVKSVSCLPLIGHAVVV